MQSSNKADWLKQPMGFMEELRLQRWDDHRYYHHSRINQSLHLLSSICFMVMYALLLFSPSAAALLGWLLAMCSRQIGHFFFEPDNYDEVNEATNEHKEEIKVGYNLSRKRVLLSIWGLSPLVLLYSPGFFGLMEPYENRSEFLFNMSMIWFGLGIAAVVFRTIHLFFIRGVQTGLVWATKIITDPFNDFCQYLKSPVYLLRGQLIDPMSEVRNTRFGEEEEPVPALAKE